MSRPPYPPAPRQDTSDVLHGHRVTDPYRWLEDRQADDTEKWLAAQDRLFHETVDALPGRDRLRARLGELLGAGSVGSPVWRGDRRFFTRRTAEQEHPVLYTVDPDGDGTERALVDPMAIDPDGTTTLDGWQPDREGRRLAYKVSHGGDEESLLYVIDVATGKRVDGPIDRVRESSVAWLPGGEAFFYVRRLPVSAVPEGEEQHHRRVYLHQVGAAPDSEDVLIFGAGRDKTNYYGVGVSRDGRWLTISSSQGTAPRNDLWIADLSASSPERPELRAVQEGVDAETGLHVGRDGRAYVFTDRDAPRSRLCVTDPADPGYETWRDLIPEDPEAVLTDFALLDDVLLAGWTRHAISEITVHDPATGERLGTVPTPGLGTIGGIIERPEGGHEAWFGYTDHTTPSAVLRYDSRTGETTPWAAAPGTVEVPRIDTRQVVYTSADGTEVRMLVASRPGDSGPRPAILYGYGGFNIPLTPAYSASILTWVEAGGVYAIANLRGGSEEGEEWHRAGMRERKQNVFDDFHAAAEKLIADGLTAADRLTISGGSNGGLLVGAALTQRPGLYRAVICSAPLLDMVRYERFGLGQTWNDEYGTAGDPAEFEWLLSYSPYHHVREGIAYPATLFTLFDSDTRVDPLHARKMCAALQHATASDRPILLRNEAEVGHAARSVSRSVDLMVDTLSFSAAQTGLDLRSASHPTAAPFDT
ncbi:prolyl oligopeptidase family serine peptidase [Actinomadura xylanilytica]|uniref:prolyl oligopeptidase family serine peptidase n=1 Tax=Actinomadura xylanilytica TaxID=887459 RepID=UPI00255A9A46|nr:prolyl oligopeptidase family serine peptidase [Actinomadura xylanilytica]MDL4777523.1 prolyl oligopeptidase family serine peptidase [Actinomadura xylanilytica]